MNTISNIEAFLSSKLNHLKSVFNSEGSVLYSYLYNDINNVKLKEVFTILHNQLNELFTFMNEKNTPGIGGHYNAEPSRELLETIQQIRLIYTNLKEDQYSFEIDEYYNNRCLSI